MITLSQQLSGINVAIFYSTKIFTDAGLVGLEAQAATLGMGRLSKQHSNNKLYPKHRRSANRHDIRECVDH